MRTRLSLAACLLLAVAALPAQDQKARDPQLPVFRTGADLVRVDMYVTKDNEFITDLRADEVEIYEDGVRQRVDTFEFVQVPEGPFESEAPSVRASAVLDPVATDVRSRVFVVFVDTYTTRLENNRDLRQSLVRFLDQLLGPTDLVALMTPEMLASEIALGRRSTVISDLANDERWTTPGDRAPDPKEFAWENCYPSRRVGGDGGGRGRMGDMRARYRGKATIAALTDLVTHLRTLREERKAVLLVTGGWPYTDDVNPNTSSERNAGETERCAQDRHALERTDFDRLLKDLSRTANRANVSFYPVNSRQERPLPPEMAAVYKQQIRQRDKKTLEWVQSQLRMLATETDGLAAVKTKAELDDVTERIIGDTSAYYLVGYQSTNTKADRRFRAITVRVTRPGVRVRNRPGYGGDMPAPRVLADTAPRKPIVDGRVQTALAVVEHFDAGAPFWGRSSVWESPTAEGGGSFWYVGELGPETRGRVPWNAGSKAEIEVLASDKTKVMTHVVELKPSDSTFVMRVPAEGSLPPGNYSVRVRLKPASDDALAVHDTIRVTLDPASASLGEAVFWRRGPSVRQAYFETADPRFRRTERMRLELPTTLEGSATARLLDRQGRQLQTPAEITERADSSGNFRWLVIETPITSLAPGDYAIEVRQGDRSRVTAFRIVP